MNLVEYVTSKVMRCSRYMNVRRMNVRLVDEPLEEVDCFDHSFWSSNMQWMEDLKGMWFRE